MDEGETKDGLPLAADHKQAENVARYVRGEIASDDDDSHLSDYVAVAQGQTTVPGLRIIKKG